MKHDIKSLHLELSKRCLLACTKCPRTRNKGQYVIDDLDINHAITSISIMNPAIVNLCGNYGDPLYYPKLLELTQWMHKNNYAFELHTNGSGKKLSWWEEYYNSYENIKYGKRHKQSVVIFGIDGLSDTHSRYRINTNWYKIIENAKAFINAGGNARWDMLVFDHNKHQVDECEQLSKDLGFRSFSKKNSSRFKDGKYHVLNDSGRTIDILYPTEKSKSFISKIEEATSDTNVNINCKSVNNSSLYISATGNVSPCCWLDVEWIPAVVDNRIQYMDIINDVPNLYKQSLEEIFDSGYFDKIASTWNTKDCLKECSKQCGKFDKLGEQFES